MDDIDSLPYHDVQKELKALGLPAKGRVMLLFNLARCAFRS
jgi:hypothetical protein